MQVEDGKNNITKYKFDDRGRVIQITDPLQQTTEIHRFAGVDPQTGRFNDRGEIIAIVTPDPDDFRSRFGSAAVNNGPLDRQTTTFQYDGHGNVILRSLPNESPTNGLVHKWTYDQNFDAPTSFTNELGHDVFYRLDAHGNVAQIRSVDPFQAHLWQNLHLRRDVNDDGSVTPIDALNVINKLNNGGSVVVGPDAGLSQFFYDVNGDDNVTRRQDQTV